jgi:hypothetical protein
MAPPFLGTNSAFSRNEGKVSTASKAKMQRLAGSSTKIVDLGGKTVVPGHTDRVIKWWFFRVPGKGLTC